MIELLHSIFPTTGFIFLSVFWVIFSMIASTLFNNQDISNKKNNAWKSFLLLFFSFSWVMTSTYYTSGRWYPSFILFAFIVWTLFIIGDLLAYWSHQLKFSPGGLPGWVWFSIAHSAKDIQAKATVRAVSTLRPTERKLYEAAVAEKDENILKALVEVTGAKIVVAPSAITSVLPDIDRLVVAPSYIINTVPKSLNIPPEDIEPETTQPTPLSTEAIQPPPPSTEPSV